VLAGLLILLRPHLVLWLIAAAAIGLRAADWFLRRSGTFDAPRSDRGAVQQAVADDTRLTEPPNWTPESEPITSADGWT
jgi:hypothetical protein